MVTGIAIAAVLAAAVFVPLLQPGDTLPALPLIDQSGRAFSIDDLRGDAVVLSFIFTRCADPAMCPLTSSKFARLQSMIGGAHVRLVEITLDPQYDTPQVLRAYGKAFHADPRKWTLATGAPASIAALAGRLAVATRWTAPGTLVHTESIIVFDRSGRIAQTVDGNAWTTDQIIAAATEAAGIAPAPLQRIGLWLTAVAQACGGNRGRFNALEGLGLLAAVTCAIAFALIRSLRLLQ